MTKSLGLCGVPLCWWAAQIWLVLLEVGEELFVYVLDSMAAEVSSGLNWNHVAKSRILGIELLCCGRIVSCDFLLLDTKWNLSAACPLPVLEAGSSEQLTFWQAPHLVWSSEHKFLSSCELATMAFRLFSAWNTGACHRKGCRQAVFSASCHIYTFNRDLKVSL